MHVYGDLGVIEYLPWPNPISFLLAMPQEQGKKTKGKDKIYVFQAETCYVKRKHMKKRIHYGRDQGKQKQKWASHALSLHLLFVTLIHPSASRLGAEITSPSGLLHLFFRWNVSQRLSSKAKTWPIIIDGENDKLAFEKDVPKDGEAYPRVRLDAAKAFFNVAQGRN